jgi:hypothetical protein
MFDPKGTHQAIYNIAEHKVLFLSEERHQLLMTTSKQRTSDIFLKKIQLFKS